MELAPLAVVVSLLVAAGLAVASPLLGRRGSDAVATMAALAVVGLCVALLIRSISHPIVYAFGGWQPRGRVVLGILFVIDPVGAGMATLAATLVAAAFVYSWRYFDTVRNLFHVLMLVFLAAMVGFSLTGDLFNLFVFFELMSVAAFVLSGYLIEERGPLQGAINYTVVSTVGAFLMLDGIALLYGRTGALNLAQIGQALAGQKADGLVIAAFVLIVSGLLVKAAAGPFHFWLPDVETVAPNPVCAVFSGALVVLGIYGVARVYWTVFAGVLDPHAHAVRAILVVLGVVTALLGAVMCLLEHHVKRLLAFSTVAHVGLFLLGMGLLTPLGQAGAAVYAIGHGLIKGALFLCVGILGYHFDTFDGNRLRGRGRAIPYVGLLFGVGGLGLSSLPPFGTFLGKGMIEDAAGTAGYPWLVVVLILTSASTGGAVLRVAGSVFLGWGQTQEDPSAISEGEEGNEEENGENEEEEENGGNGENEQKGPRGKTPAVMFVPALVLMALALALGLVPGLSHAVEAATARFQDRPDYAAAVLAGVHGAPLPALEPAGPTVSMVVSGLIATAGGLAIALAILFRSRISAGLRRLVNRPVAPVLAWLRAIQSGHVGDYVTWLTLGVAILGVVCAATLR